MTSCIVFLNECHRNSRGSVLYFVEVCLRCGVVEWLRLEAIASTLAANQDEFSNAWQFFLPCKERQSFYRRWLMLLDCVSACKTVLFKFVPCALQLHTLIRRKSPVDPIVHRGKSLGV